MPTIGDGLGFSCSRGTLATALCCACSKDPRGPQRRQQRSPPTQHAPTSHKSMFVEPQHQATAAALTADRQALKRSTGHRRRGPGSPEPLTQGHVCGRLCRDGVCCSQTPSALENGSLSLC